MDIFHFVSWCLAIVAVVTLAWPVNAVLMGLAFRVRQGQTPLDMEATEYWTRSVFAALGLAGLSLVLLGINYGLVSGRDLPIGIVQMVLLLCYLPAAAGFVFWMMGLEDILQGFSVFLLYVLLPGLPVLVIGRLAGLWDHVKIWAPWLLPSS
jgi:hypothetical protein